MESWKNYTAALEAAVGKADDASVKSAADNLKLGSTKLSPDGAEKLAAAIGIMNDKIAVVNKAQRELAEAQQVVTNYKAEVALLRQINVDARLEQELVTNQNKGTLSQIEQALKQQGITGRTEVKLYLDSNGELLLTPDAGINPQAVIGIFNRSGDSIKLEKVIISTSTAPKAGEKASAVFSQLDEISPRRTVRFWEKNIEIEKEPVSSGTTRFQSRFDNAIDVNIQNISPTSPSTVTPISAEQIEKEAKADLVGRQKVIFDSNTGQITSSPVSENQIRLTLIRRGYDPNDPSLDEAVRRISDEINPQSQAVQESVIEQSYDELNRLIDQDTANSSPEVQAKMKQIAEIVRKRDEKLAAMASANGGEFIPFKVEDQFRELAAFRRDLGISGVTVNERPTGPVLQTISSTTGRTTTFKSIETIPQGLIVFPPKTIPAEDTVRLYRGVGDFDMNTPQLAALARSGEVSTQDIFDFWDGKITYDDLIDKLDDQSTIDFIRDQIQVQKRNNPDWTNDQILGLCTHPSRTST
jgi:hypothetical protein